MTYIHFFLILYWFAPFLKFGPLPPENPSWGPVPSYRPQSTENKKWIDWFMYDGNIERDHMNKLNKRARLNELNKDILLTHLAFFTHQNCSYFSTPNSFYLLLLTGLL